MLYANNNEIGFHSKQHGIEFHGDKGSLFLSNWPDFMVQWSIQPAPIECAK